MPLDQENHVEPDFEVWKEYAYRENIIRPSSYLGIKRQNFCQIETTGGRETVCCRPGME